jgi:glycosyltransferase involved in cell wall biosynthesis
VEGQIVALSSESELSVYAPSQGVDLIGVVQLSVIIPIFNEEESIPLLCDRLFEVLKRQSRKFEVVAVNDGSTDGSLAALRRETVNREGLRVLDLRRNYGQTAALMAGFDHARGDIIVTIDGDLQNDPDDIPVLIAKLEEGFDVASGWRRERQDSKVRRNFVSRVANRLISRISGLQLHDYGCTLKAYRRDIMDGVRLYGEMHRFIPIHAHWMGAKVIEVPVRHHARRFGHSKYGLERVIKVVLDLAVLKFFDRYLVKPIYIFGGFGLLTVAMAFAALFLAIAMRVFIGISLIQTPLPLLSAILLVLGMISILLGLLAEILMRTYFESQGRFSYRIREEIRSGQKP